MSYDGSCGETFGKLKIIHNVNLTNEQKDTLNFDIGRRIFEDDIVDQMFTIFYSNIGY